MTANPFKSGVIRTYFERGRQAAKEGKPRKHNPYERSNASTLSYYKAWDAGHQSYTAQKKQTQAAPC